VGDLLAEGSLRAAKTLGQAAVDLTVTVKGQELPAHMPQHKRSLGLIYAVNAFGADHQSSEHDSMLRAKPGSLQRRRLAEIGEFGDMDLRDLSDDKVRFAYTTQCFYSALDTLGLCQFVWGPSWQLYGPSETVELVHAGTGWDATMSELMKIGERKINLMRAFNAREGIGKEADTLPKKLFQPLTGKGPTAGVALTQEEFAHARATYYELAGCDPFTGYPTRAKLTDLGLEWLADTMPAAR
jgi:aldehyde:ferredoxin oxidoreductase